MRKFIDWLLNRDNDYIADKKRKRNDFKPGGQPQDLAPGLKMLDETMVDLTIATTKYSRILVILTGILVILTIVLVLRGK